MRRAVILTAPLLALAACTGDPAAQAPTSSSAAAPATSGARPTSQAPAQVPPAPEPVADGPCPYLTSTAVADANGQHVTKVRTSADKPTPACFFYRPDGSVQLTIRVYQGEPAVAKALVDSAAPIDTSNPATSPAGWEGGSLSGEENAVYAVAKGGAAVVVDSNQKQTIKARRIAETAIENLGL
ncbi:DUF2020 domain-containing protein [Actinokineospora bangkokensis]|uniref:DUF2020 domain-containing protein n=1 Tax=Actinokineospora bangkokensis TaxID=1193682 RepID=A0A1Q9LU48_9PSEU|nr:DUF2020 domain-containing protein [Actinokineospora bangkokensis]OLR95531.1 hypothetical protein BJP25_00065 [Actinokineospora bangkokensis]